MDERRSSARLTADEIAWRCPPDWLPFETTDELGACDENLGQDRAVDALEVALRLRGRGFNVYVAGNPGSGRTRTARRIVREEAAGGPVPDDICYVHNFKDPSQPRLLRLPAGCGHRLRTSLEGAVGRMRNGLSALRSSSAHRRKRESVSNGFRGRQSQIVSDFQAEVEREGFALVEIDHGAFRQHDLTPVVDGKPVAMEDLEELIQDGSLTQEQLGRIRDRRPALAARLSETTARAREIGRERDLELAEADRLAAMPLIELVLDEIRAAVGIAYGERKPLDDFLRSLRDFLLEVTPYLFLSGDRLPPQDPAESPPPDPLAALKVNVLVDRAFERGMPIVEEAHPDHTRLFGHVETFRGPDGSLRADLLGLRAGALQRADGGFLLLNAHDLLTVEGLWAGLRRVLRSGEVSLHAGTAGDGPAPLRPEPAPVEVTVILVGTPALRAELAEQDPEFEKMFKIVALFDDHVDLTKERVWSYACFLAHVIREEGLRHVEAGAVGRMIEVLVRSASGRGRLSTNFRLFTDIAREASLIGERRDRPVLTVAEIDEALAARARRSAFLSQRITEAFRGGVLQISVDGERVGQVNGLAVVDTSFGPVGYPVRITATAAVGRSGIIDIEREAELSGEIHTKASLILAGFLRSQFAQKHPLSMTASICFEQSYGGVDGDSASSAELAALLSALAEVPVRQDLAVTGAVDQHGQVLAVGGVDDKIEGFWRLCSDRGLTGDQGVIVPAASVRALQLHPDVVADVERGRFHVFAVSDVDGLMELLTGVALGKRRRNGAWPAKQLGGRIASRLKGMAEIMREYGLLDAK